MPLLDQALYVQPGIQQCSGPPVNKLLLCEAFVDQVVLGLTCQSSKWLFIPEVGGYLTGSIKQQVRSGRKAVILPLVMVGRETLFWKLAILVPIFCCPVVQESL